MFTASVTDISFLYKGLPVDLRRTYRPSYTSNGSLGSNWAFSYDTRIIRGYNTDYAGYAREMRRLASDTLRLWNTANSNYNTAMAELNRALAATKTAITSAQNLLNLADSILASARQIRNSSVRSTKVSAAEQRKTTAARLLNEAKAEKQKVLTAQAQLKALLPGIQNMRRTYESLNRTALQAEQAKTHGDIQVYLNRHSIFPGDPAHLAETGLNTITLVDENGAPHLYNLDTSPDYSSNTTYRQSQLLPVRKHPYAGNTHRRETHTPLRRAYYANPEEPNRLYLQPLRYSPVHK